MKEPSQQPGFAVIGRQTKSAVRIAAFVGSNKMPLGIAGIVCIVIIVWLLHRDGYQPEESTGEITITNSSGEVINRVSEQAEILEKQADENL